MSKEVVQNDKDALLLWFYMFVGRYVDPYITRPKRTLRRIELLKRLCQLWKDNELEDELAWVRSSSGMPGQFLAERLLGAVWVAPEIIHTVWRLFFRELGLKDSVPPPPCSVDEVEAAIGQGGLFPIYVSPEWIGQIPQSVEAFNVLARQFGFVDTIFHRMTEQAGVDSIVQWEELPNLSSGWLWTEASLRFHETELRLAGTSLPTLYPQGVYSQRQWRPMSLLAYVVFSRFVQWASDMAMCPDSSPLSYAMMPGVEIRLLGGDESRLLQLGWEYIPSDCIYSLRQNDKHDPTRRYGGFRSLLPME